MLCLFVVRRISARGRAVARGQENRQQADGSLFICFDCSNKALLVEDIIQWTPIKRLLIEVQ